MSQKSFGSGLRHATGSGLFKSGILVWFISLGMGAGFMFSLPLAGPGCSSPKAPEEASSRNAGGPIGATQQTAVHGPKGLEAQKLAHAEPAVEPPEPLEPPPEPGTLENPIIDSSMTRAEALEGVHPDCPQEVIDKQELFEVKYLSFTGKIHQGQMMMDRRLAPEIKEIFDLARELKFPFHLVIPISHPAFRKNERWDDDLSMAANNTSGFNYRRPTGGGPVSKKGHAMGFAFDINPRQNPYIKRKKILPPGSKYDPDEPGSLSADHPIVKRLLKLGWTWGGSWRSLKDYQHFEKTPMEKKTKARP